MRMPLDLSTGAVIGLLAIIATVDVAQFTVTLHQERRLTRVEATVCSEDD